MKIRIKVTKKMQEEINEARKKCGFEEEPIKEENFSLKKKTSEKKEIEQDIRIEARGWCGPIETDKGASENQVENIALHFYNKGYEKCQEQKRKQVEELKKIVHSEDWDLLFYDERCDKIDEIFKDIKK